MKNHLVCALLLGLFSCSENSSEKAYENVEINNEQTLGEAEVIDTDEKEIGLEKKDIVAVNHSNWQIDDYVEHLLGSKVAANSSESETPMNYYYQDLDLKGGYAEVTGAYEGGSTFALWRMSNGSDLIGITTYGCGPVCDYTFEFFEFSDGQREDVTEKILPKNEMEDHFLTIEKKMREKYPDMEDENGQYQFELPKKGTDLILNMSIDLNEIEFPIMILSWDKEKFSVKKKLFELGTY